MSVASDLMSAAVANANTMRTDAQASLDKALATMGEPMIIHPGAIPITPLKLDFTPGDVPQYGGPHYTEPKQDFGKAPDMVPIPAPTYQPIGPKLDARNPGYTDPATPAGLRTFDDKPPTPADLTVPPSPDALTNFDFTPPVPREIVVPDTPHPSLPEFSAQRPNTDLTPPSDLATTFEQNYQNISPSMRQALNAEMDAQLNKINPGYTSQLAALEARLNTYIAGGTALPVSVEQNIYNRARDKTNDEYLNTRDTVWQEGAKRGFTIPGGAQFSALTQARQAAADNNAHAAMDIATKQAEMEQNNIQFALTQSQTLRVAVMGAMNAWFGSLIQLNGQGLEYARDVLQATIALYDTKVKLATAAIEIYKADAQVYEVRLKAVLAVYDVYRAEIEGLKAQVEVDHAKVELYSARMSALGALANAYRATIDGVVAKASIEKIKVDIFGAQVQAFSAEVGAKQAEWTGFTAQVNGKTAAISAYGEEVRAYGTEVQARGTEIQAYEAQVRAATAQNEGAYRVYTAAVQAWSEQVRGMSVSVQAEVSSFEATLHAYVAKVTASEAFARLGLQEQETVLRAAIAQYDTDARVLIASANGYNNYMKAAADVAVSAGTVYGNMAGSAMAGIGTLAAEINQQTR
jgi:hypothetical protein